MSHTIAFPYSSKELRQIQGMINHGKYHKILPLGAIRTIRELGINHKISAYQAIETTKVL